MIDLCLDEAGERDFKIMCLLCGKTTAQDVPARTLSVSPITFFLSFLVIILTYRIFALEKDLRNMKS